MNKLPAEKRIQVIQCLLEGMSIRGTVRMTGASKGAVLRLVAEVGPACERFHRRFVHDVPCKRLELDETWSFTFGKTKNLQPERKNLDGFGTTWTWLAVASDEKLILSYSVTGDRNEAGCLRFVRDVAYRLRGKVQITTDALAFYTTAIPHVFQPSMVDYATLNKDYKGSDPAHPDTRYSPGRIRRSETKIRIGDPDPDYISTSYVERVNLTLRMSSRRYTRLTNAHSKKIQFHRWALAMHIWAYNWARPHMTLEGRTPAQAAGLTDYRFNVADMLNLAMWADERMLLQIGA